MWRTALLFFLAPQWCLPSTKPGVSTVLPALHATPSWLSSKCCAGLKDKSILNPRCRSDLVLIRVHLRAVKFIKTTSFIFLLLCTFRHLSFPSFCLFSTNLHLFQQLYFYLSADSLCISLFPFSQLYRLPPPLLSSSLFILCLFVFPASYLAFFLALSGISLWRWIWSQCVSTATNACQTTWGAALPSASVTQKRRRRSRWYPCVCDALSICPLLLLSLWSVSFSFAFFVFVFSFSCLFYSLFFCYYSSKHQKRDNRRHESLQ